MTLLVSSESVRDLLCRTLAITNPSDIAISRSSHAEWDSLKHLEIVFMLEEVYGVRFSEEDIHAMQDIDTIVKYVRMRIDDSAAG